LPIVGLDAAAAEKGEPIARNLDDPPAGAAEARIDAEDANRGCAHAL
jgi:hypothetical protein